MERLGYLTPDQRRSIGNWIADLEPLKDRYPILNKVDLIIEGGVGNGQTMAHIARAFFPRSRYVGMDLAPTLMASKPRQLHHVDSGVLKEILDANDDPTLEMDDAILHANCFDGELVTDIAKQIGAQVPFLASFNALSALVDRKMNPWDSKDDDDITPLEKIVGRSPYTGQLHMLNDPSLWDDAAPLSAIHKNFYDLEAVAMQTGWQTERLDCGLLLIQLHE